jgi:enoyl-CoA hydratase/carnithine racemase
MFPRTLLVSARIGRKRVVPKGLLPSETTSAASVTMRWHSPPPTSSTQEVLEDPQELKTSLSDSGVLILTLNRPQQRNALNVSLLESLLTELESAASVPRDVRAIVLQAEGRIFSSGHDLKELMSLDQAGQQHVFDLCSTVMQLLSGIPQPTICAVEGLATAAGCQLVAACDLGVGDPRSGYATPGAKTIGLFCHTPGVPLVRCIGLKKSLDMLYTGRTITASEAVQYGLITHVAANPRREALKLAVQIAGQSACAMQSGKRTLYQQIEAESLKAAYQLASAAMVENLQTKDAKEGIDAFIGKRGLET